MMLFVVPLGRSTHLLARNVCSFEKLLAKLVSILATTTTARQAYGFCRKRLWNLAT